MNSESEPVKRLQTPRTGLVLSGGFLRSAFQVGVIEALHASGVRFDMVVGVSSGAWNAACVAAGQMARCACASFTPAVRCAWGGWRRPRPLP